MDNTGIIEVGQDFASELCGGTADIYCSLVSDDMESKKLLYKAMTKPDFKLNDCFNKKIAMKDIFCETVLVAGDDGTERQCPRIVIIDAEGKSYQSVSFGVFNALKRIMTIFGEPTWEEPLTIVPVQISKGKNKLTSLEVV